MVTELFTEQTTEPLTVLRVDDDPACLDPSAAVLQQDGDDLRVIPALSSAEGMDQSHTHEEGCLVSDYDMPAMPGLDFLDDDREEYPQLPFNPYIERSRRDETSPIASALQTLIP